MQDMEIMAERHNNYLLNKYLDEISVEPEWRCMLCDETIVDDEDDICDECKEYIDFVHAIVHLGTEKMQEYALESCELIDNIENKFCKHSIEKIIKEKYNG